MKKTRRRVYEDTFSATTFIFIHSFILCYVYYMYHLLYHSQKMKTLCNCLGELGERKKKTNQNKN